MASANKIEQIHRVDNKAKGGDQTDVEGRTVKEYTNNGKNELNANNLNNKMMGKAMLTKCSAEPTATNDKMSNSRAC